MKHLFLLIFSCLCIFLNAQNPLPCNANNCTTNSNINNCPAGSSNLITDFNTNTQRLDNPCSNGLCVGSVWRFSNIATQLNKTINAEVRIVNIVNATLNNIDDNANPSTVPTNFFAPRIGPDVNLTTTGGNRRGWVEFEIKFFDAAQGNGYTTLQLLENLNFVFHDIDGSGNANSWFREIGHIRKPSASNPTIQALAGTELFGESYVESGTTWDGFIGSVCERDGVSSCAEVAAQANFAAPQNTITIRMGYDSRNGGNNIGQPTRQFGARFGCFQFPTTQSLPVTFSNFQADKTIQNNVRLSWQTTTEIDNKEFEIQRSIGSATNFETIVTIPSQAINGNSSMLLNYHFIDTKNLTENTYYRILQKDKNERISYSATRLVKFGSKNDITVYPNPSKDGNIEVKVSEKLIGGTIVVKSASGSILFNIKINATSTKLVLLSTGYYYLTIIDKYTQVVRTEKVIVQ